MRSDGTFRHKDHATNQTDVVRWRDERNSFRGMRWSPQGFERKSNSKLGSKETQLLVTKATGRRRDIDETLMQHECAGIQEGSWNKLSSNEIVDTEENLAVQTPGRLENAACMSEHTSGSRRSDKGNCVKHCGRNSVLRCEAIADQTDTQKVRVTRHCQTLAGDGIVVARAGSIAWKHAGGCASERVRVAPPELMGGSSRTVLRTVGETACCDARPSRMRLTHRKSESHGTVRRLPEMASSWRVRVASLGSTQGAASERVRVAPPELMGGSSRTVLRTVGEIACCDARPSQMRLDTQKVRVTRHCQTLAGDGIAWKHAGGCVRASAGSTARVDGWIIKDRVDIEANLPDLGADRNGSRGEGDLWQQCNM